MQFTIYSIGDSEFLEQVLIAVAMLMNHGEVQTAVMVSALIAILLTGFSAMANGGKEFNVSSIIVGFILFLAFFVPKTTVIVEDTVTGQIRVVDNVPLAIGASGGIISALGYGIGELFEQGYSLTGTQLSNGYFAESLVILSNLRTKAYNSNVLTAMSEDTETDLAKDLNNYVKDCLAVAMTLKEINEYKAGTMNIFTLFEEGKIAANSHGTKISTNLSGGYETPTCSVAHGTLMSRLNTAISSGTKTRLVLGSVAQQLGPALLKSGGFDPSNQLMVDTNNALQSLNISSINAQQYMQAIILEGVYLEGIEAYYASANETTNQMMVRQAIEQRNTQWAAEQSLFLSTVRPLQAFFESFIYAIAPFIAILLVAGKVGYGLASKYLLSLIWIQLWFPMLSIINMFIYIGTAREFRQYSSGGGTQLLSQYGLDSANQIAQNWAATGGMLAASTPVIALFLVTGSVYTMNSIAGRMSGSAHVDPKQASPDVRNSPPVMQSSAHSDGNAHTGTVKTGMASTLPSFNVSHAAANSETSALAASQTAQILFSNSLKSGFIEAVSNNKGMQFVDSLGGSVRSSNDSSLSSVSKFSNSIGQASNLSKQEQRTLDGVMAMGAQISGSFEPVKMLKGAAQATAALLENTDDPAEKEKLSKTQKAIGGALETLTGVNVGIGAELSGKGSIGQKLSEGFSLDDKQSITESADRVEQDTATLHQALAHSISEDGTISNSFGSSSSKGRDIAKSASDVISTGKQYTQAAQATATVGNSRIISGPAFATQMLQHYGQNLSGLSLGLSSSDNQSINSRARDLQHHAGVSPYQAHAMATAEHLYRNDPDKFAGMVSDMYGHTQGDMRSGDNSSLEQVDFGNTRTAVENGVNKPLDVPSGLQSMQKGSVYDAFNPENSSNEQVYDHNNQARFSAEGWNSHKQMGITAKRLENSINDVNNNGPAELNRAAKTMDRTSDLIDNFTNNPSFSTGYDLFKGLVPKGVIQKASSSFGAIEDGMDYLKTQGNNILSAPVLNQLQDTLTSHLGNEDKVMSHAQNDLGLTPTQASYYAAKTANFTDKSTTKEKEAVRQEAYNNASKIVGPEEASKYADSVVSFIDNAATYGHMDSAALGKIKAINDDFGRYNHHEQIANPFFSPDGNSSSNTSGGQSNNGFFLTETSNRSGTSMGLPSQAMYSPVQGARVSSEFNERRVRGNGSVYHHGGIDFAAPEGTPIYSTEAGVVTRTAYDKNGYGHYAMIDHGNGLSTLYAHMPNTKMLEKGQRVEAGEQIGVVGNTGTSTGPHLHFEVVNNNLVNDGKWGESKFEPRPYLANVLR